MAKVKKKSTKKAARRRAPRRPSVGMKAQKKPVVGRRTTLTQDVHDKIVQTIAAGNYYVTAFRMAGVAESTFYKWMKRGEDEILRLMAEEERTGETVEPDKNEAIYVEFVEAVKKAEAQGEVVAVLKVKSAFGNNWQAAMTFLERRHRERWGRSDRHELTGPGGGPIRTSVVVLPDNGRGDRDGGGGGEKTG